MAVFAASEWKSKLGLNIETESMEFKVLLKKRHDGTFEMARNGWVADYNDATTFLALIRCDSDQNNNFNCNRKAEELINQGSQSTDPVKRKTLLTQASKMIMDDYPIIPLLQHQRVPQENGRVRGIGMEDQAGSQYRDRKHGVQGVAEEAARRHVPDGAQWLARRLQRC